MDEEVILAKEDFEEALLEKSKSVFSCICDYFGEDRCDFQVIQPVLDNISDYSLNNLEVCRDNIRIIANILIYFPEVEITNPEGLKHTIKELYVKITISPRGTCVGTFKMLRTKFTYIEAFNGYVHSHCQTSSNPTDFRECCLGEGPIKFTLMELRNEFDIERWNIFCFQLEQYVGIESGIGTPYFRIANLLPPEQVSTVSSFSLEWKEILVEDSTIPEHCVYNILMKIDMDFVTQEGVLVPNMSLLEFLIKVTKIVDGDLPEEFFIVGKLKGEILYPRTNGYAENVRIYEGHQSIIFKGTPTTIRFEKDLDTEPIPWVRLLKPKYVGRLVKELLIYINITRNINSNGKYKTIYLN